jgi:hypothetical protein
MPNSVPPAVFPFKDSDFRGSGIVGWAPQASPFLDVQLRPNEIGRGSSFMIPFSGF